MNCSRDAAECTIARTGTPRWHNSSTSGLPVLPTVGQDEPPVMVSLDQMVYASAVISAAP